MACQRVGVQALLHFNRVGASTLLKFEVLDTFIGHSECCGGHRSMTYLAYGHFSYNLPTFDGYWERVKIFCEMRNLSRYKMRNQYISHIRII